MNVLDRLAFSLERRDEVPNQELAAEILRSADIEAVNELVSNLSNKNKGIRYDCIKVLYEIGYVEPEMIADHLPVFLDLLTSKDNRLQWGAMTAIGSVVKVKPAEVFESLSKIVDAADKGSVITRDHCVNILISLSGIEMYADTAFPLLLEQMIRCPENQLPMYAERSVSTITTATKKSFIKVLTSRMISLEKDSGRRRLQKVVARLSR